MKSVKLSQCPTRAAHGNAVISASYLLIVVTAALFGLSGCNRTGEEPGKYAVTYQTDSLPDLTLTDQYGHQLSLASLRGKPVLFDFI